MSKTLETSASRLDVLPIDGRPLTLAAAMLQYPGTYADAGPVAQQPAENWLRMLAPIQKEGFSSLELSCSWLDIALLPSDRLVALNGVLRELGLHVAGCLIARRSIVHPQRGPSNVEHAAAVIRAAAQLGAQFVCVGLHEIAPLGAGGPLWFWNGERQEAHADRFDFAVCALRDLSALAADHGLGLSLETYPGTLVGSAQQALRLYEAVGHHAFGINPDLGNFVREQGPVENWADLAVTLLPICNYWHVKNYSRLELEPGAKYATHPAPLDEGVIDYRKCVNYARSVGFCGPIIVEHYGGDGLSISARGRQYLSRLTTAA